MGPSGAGQDVQRLQRARRAALTDQQLITYGPYALVRNPMYVGIIAATLGGLLIYRTWSMVFALTFFGLVIRARREEQALAAEFG